MSAVNSKIDKWIACGSIFLSVLVLSGCQTNSCQIEPQIVYAPPRQFVESLPSAFPPLSVKEYRQDWGKELIIANAFARELDLYRAITSYKRALILLPGNLIERRQEIEYGIVLSYYLGQKYQDVVETFEHGVLCNATDTFPAYDDLLIILYDSYHQLGKEERASKFLNGLDHGDNDLVSRLQLSEAVQKADFCTLTSPPFAETADAFMMTYNSQAKSVSKAQTLNAVIPGAGYFYVGQKQTAFTSLMINALFIAAAYHFFEHGNIAGGIIVSSLEFGWYFGGINGAGLAAKEYNERLYDCTAKEFMLQRKLFPVLMLNYAF